MTPQELRRRLARFARDARAFAVPLIASLETREEALQLKRASSSAASNHRAAGRARSRAEFISKLTVALEEADESQFWLEHCRNCQIGEQKKLLPLLSEASELVAILTVSEKTARGNRRPPEIPD